MAWKEYKGETRTYRKQVGPRKFRHPTLSPQKYLRRWRNIVAMYWENYSLEEVGAKFNMTRERVRQLLNQYGTPPRPYTLVLPSSFIPRRGGLTFRERFWAQVDRGQRDECWEWQGSVWHRHGYGDMWIRQLQERYTHRIAYILGYNKKPRHWVLHSCDNTRCCNPRHLRDAHGKENVKDRHKRGLEAWRTNIRASASTKLTAEDVRIIRQREFTAEYYAKKFNVSHGYIYNLWSKTMRLWVDVPFHDGTIIGDKYFEPIKKP